MQPIPWADGRLVDRDGAATWLWDGRPVIGWRLGQIRIAGRRIDAEPGPPRTEIDEYEQTVAIAPDGTAPLRISLRHSLDRTWAVRLSVVNAGDEAIRIDRLTLRATTGPDWVGWATRAGAEASVAALPCRPGDPLIGFSLLQGELRGDGPDLVVGPLDLPAHGQQVVRLRGEPYGSAREFARGRHDILPDWGWAAASDEIQVHHPDLAVVDASVPVVPEPVPDSESVPDPDVTTLVGGPGDRARLVLAGSRGMVEIEVGFAPGLELLLDRFVQEGERHWPTGRQGIRIPSAAAALVIQRQAASESRGRRPVADWVEAVEGVCARIDEPTSAFEVALLARQSTLTGDGELAALATSGCRHCDAPALVAPEVMAARQLTGLAPTLLEATGQGLATDDQTELYRVGASWGLGLRGSRLGSDDLVADARALADTRMRALLQQPRPRGWACGHDELLTRHERRIQHRLWARLGESTGDPTADPDLVAALGWLVLAPTP